MKRYLSVSGMLLMVTALTAGSARAQFFNVPVLVSPSGFTGIEIAAGAGFGVNDESGKDQTYFGTATLGLPILSLTAGAGLVSLDDPADDEVQFGGNATLRVFGGPLIPVSVNIFAGAAYLSSGEGVTEANALRVPIGVGVGLDIPTPGVKIEPWIAPQINFVRQSGEGVEFLFGDSFTRTGFGASAGVNFGFPNGIGAWAAFDVLGFSEKDVASTTFGSVTPVTASLGLSYKFKVPGLGVPGV